MKKQQNSGLDPEIAAIGAVHRALEGLAPDALARVLNYVAGKLKVDLSALRVDPYSQRDEPDDIQVSVASRGAVEAPDDGLEGTSPVAKKWMARNGFSAQALGTIFSLGGDEIDLIAKTIPGKSIRDRMHSVLLLMGVSAYLASGAARFTNERLKEACLHYKAYDSTNFASYLKSFSAEVSGDKNTAYVLSPRGLSSATEMVKSLIESEKAK